MRRSGTRARLRRGRGSVIIGVLFFILIFSILLVGVGQFVVSHQTRAKVDGDYAAVLDIAEAGINYELRKISSDPSLADQAPGNGYVFGRGVYTVRCVNRDGSSPWVAPGLLYIYSTGALDGTRRSVRAAVKGYTSPGKYAIYTMESISVWNGSAINIVGDIGSNGKFDFSGHPGLNGSVYFNGPGAGWYGAAPGGYNVISETNPLTWDTVSQKAFKRFPNSGLTAPGGLAYIAGHNDNASAVPPIIGNSITSSVKLVGKPGGADYYITNMALYGNDKITFDNQNGPINIWIGPEGGTNVAVFRGGTAAVSGTQDPAKMCNVFVATKGGLNIAGNEVLDAVIYAYNKDGAQQPYGYIINSGNPTINGQILTNKADVNGNLTVNYIPNLIKPTSFSYYGYDNSWVEINPR